MECCLTELGKLLEVICWECEDHGFGFGHVHLKCLPGSKEEFLNLKNSMQETHMLESSMK
jgi:hypothetical protein